MLADTVARYTPEYTASVAEIPVEQILALAQIWGATHPLAVRVGFGLSHWYRGDLTMQALLTLQALTGNIGVHGGGVTTFAGGLTTTAFDLAGWWAPKGTNMFSVLEPMDACGAMLEGKPFPVRAAWFMVDNFAQQMSDRNKVVKALQSLDFLVVSDYVLSATADLADIVLPACTYVEKTDLLSSNNFYLQYMPKMIDPLFESKSDLDAIRLVAEKMGVGKYFDQSPDEYLQARSCTSATPKADPTVVGLTWEQLTTGRRAPEHRPDALRAVLQQAVPHQERQDRVLRRDAGALRPGGLRCTRSRSRRRRPTPCSRSTRSSSSRPTPGSAPTPST